MDITALGAIKNVSALVVSSGVGAVVGNVIRTTTPADTKLRTKVCVVVGSFVLSNLVGGIAANYTKDTIDDVAENVKEASTKIKEAKVKNKENK